MSNMKTEKLKEVKTKKDKAILYVYKLLISQLKKDK